MTQNKVALVTGGGTGVGKASALALARAGYALALAGRRADPLQAVAAAIEAGGGRAIAVPTDVADPASVAALFARVKQEFGRLDLLFNNAGANAPAIPVEDLDFAEWKKVVDANLTGPFLCTQQAFRIMRDQNPRGGRIINNGSISAHAPRPHTIPYTATKHAITGLTKTAALDGRRYDIAVGQIDIGNALTEMAQRMTTGVMQADGEIKIEPVMDPEHVANAVVHMAGLPLDANILFLTVMATKMPYVGRG